MYCITTVLSTKFNATSHALNFIVMYCITTVLTTKFNASDVNLLRKSLRHRVSKYKLHLGIIKSHIIMSVLIPIEKLIMY